MIADIEARRDLIGSARVSSGNIAGMYPIFKFAFNPEIATGATEDVWSYGGDLSYLSSSETMDVVSSDASDTMDVYITGVDADYNQITDIVTLNGITPVTTSKEFLRVWRAEIGEESQDLNAGNITITASVSATVQAYIDEDNGQTEMSHFTVPSGYTAFLVTAYAASSRNDDAIVRVQTRSENYAFRTKTVIEVSESPTLLSFMRAMPSFQEKTDIKVTALAETNNSRVSINYELVVIKNKLLT